MNKKLNKLQLDILKRHVGPFIFCFFTVMFLLLMQFLILHIDKLVGKGIPLGIIIELILTNLAAMVVLAAPMAVLVASLMAYGKFSERNELTALRAAGVNPIHVIKPVLVVATVMSLGLMWFSNEVLPDSNQRAHSLFMDIRMKKPGFDLKENEFYKGIDGYTFLVENIENKSDSLYNITLFQEPTNKKNRAIIRAKRGTLQSEDNRQTLTLLLFDGTVQRYFDRRKKLDITKMVEETNFNRYRISFDLSELAFSRSNPDQRSRHDRTMKIQAMAAVIDSLRNEIKNAQQRTYSEGPLQSVQKAKPKKIPSIFPKESTYQKFKDPYKSKYLVLNLLSYQNHQKNLADRVLTDLRNQKTSYENLISNTEWRIKRIASYLVEIHKKFSIPLGCIVFLLLGAPIGMYTRKGNLGYAALISTFFLTFYFISIIQGEKLADRLYISPATGMWFANVILGIIGIYLVVRLCTSFKISNLWKSE